MPSGSGYYATDYATDTALIRTRFQRFWFGVLCAVAVGLPFILSMYNLHLLNLALFTTIGVLALNLLSGFTGLISLGQAAFLAIGGFTAVIFGVELHFPFYAVVPLAAIMGAVSGFIVGLPSLRLRGVYVALSTIALHFLIITAARKYQSLVHGGVLTGFSLPKATIGPLTFDTTIRWYFLLLVLTAAFTFFCINLVRRSRVGRALIATRDRDTAASALGINIGYYKLTIFTFSSAVVSVVGCINAYYLSYVSVESYDLSLSVIYLGMTIIGGAGSIAGCFYGAFFLTLLPYWLSDLFNMLPVPQVFHTYFFSIERAIYGFLIVLFLILEPTGIAGIIGRVRNYIEFWPFKYRWTAGRSK